MVAPPETPRERQRIRLPEPELAALREWAVERTGLTAAARVRDPAGRVALVENEWSERWVLPGGAVEPGECTREAARREVEEETGLVATLADPVVVVEQSYCRPDGTPAFDAEYVVYAGRAEGSIPAPSDLGTDGEEIAAARWFETVPETFHDDVLRPYLRDGSARPTGV